MNIVDLDKLCEMFWDGNYMEIHKDDIPTIPSAFEEMTNGEVIKALFPNALRSDYIENDMLILYLQDENESEMVVPEDWWNAPYKAESEE